MIKCRLGSYVPLNLNLDHWLSNRTLMGNMHVVYSKHKISSTKHCPTFIKELCHQFSLEDLKKSTNNFDEARKLGQSLYSIVYKGYLKHNGENEYPVALERMTLRLGDWMFKKVIELHSQLHHPNLISLIGFCDQKDEKIIVYEYMFNGSLYDHLRSRDLELLSWKKRLEISIGVARGLHYLHTGAKRTIFHCDIKPRTILLDNQMVPKLAQLGISLQEKRSKSKPAMIKLDTDELQNIIGNLSSFIFRGSTEIRYGILVETVACIISRMKNITFYIIIIF